MCVYCLLPIFYNLYTFMHTLGSAGGSDGKGSDCNAGDLGLIPRLGRYPGEENGKALQYSCLENSIDRGPWQATVHGVAKSQTQLRDFSFHFNIRAGRICHYYLVAEDPELEVTQ